MTLCKRLHVCTTIFHAPGRFRCLEHRPLLDVDVRKPTLGGVGAASRAIDSLGIISIAQVSVDCNRLQIDEVTEQCIRLHDNGVFAHEVFRFTLQCIQTFG